MLKKVAAVVSENIMQHLISQSNCRFFFTFEQISLCKDTLKAYFW